MRVVALSDTHGSHDYVGKRPVPKLPDGDVLVHAGDFSAHGTEDDAVEFADWFVKQPHAHKVVVAGNHDWFAQNDPADLAKLFEDYGFHYLNDSAVILDGVKFYGSPWTSQFYNWAFMETEEELAVRWEKIPLDTDVLVTHSPPLDVLDRNRHIERCGSKSLYDRTRIVNPKLHVFGHIHEGRDRRFSSLGVEVRGDTTYANVSFLDMSYWPYGYEQQVFEIA